MTEQVSIAKSAKIVGRHLCTGPNEGVISYPRQQESFEETHCPNCGQKSVSQNISHCLIMKTFAMFTPRIYLESRAAASAIGS